MSEHMEGPWAAVEMEDGTWTIWRRGKSHFVTEVTGTMATEANARLIAAAPQMRNYLTSALAWWYDQHYDGPETTIPVWVAEAEQALGEILSPDGDTRDRHEAVEAAISKADL